MQELVTKYLLLLALALAAPASLAEGVAPAAHRGRGRRVLTRIKLPAHAWSN
jgi:hypothetical protein